MSKKLRICEALAGFFLFGFGGVDNCQAAWFAEGDLAYKLEKAQVTKKQIDRMQDAYSRYIDALSEHNAGALANAYTDIDGSREDFYRRYNEFEKKFFRFVDEEQRAVISRPVYLWREYYLPKIVLRKGSGNQSLAATPLVCDSSGSCSLSNIFEHTESKKEELVGLIWQNVLRSNIEPIPTPGNLVTEWNKECIATTKNTKNADVCVAVNFHEVHVVAADRGMLFDVKKIRERNEGVGSVVRFAQMVNEARRSASDSYEESILAKVWESGSDQVMWYKKNHKGGGSTKGLERTSIPVDNLYRIFQKSERIDVKGYFEKGGRAYIIYSVVMEQGEVPQVIAFESKTGRFGNPPIEEPVVWKMLHMPALVKTLLEKR